MGVAEELGLDLPEAAPPARAVVEGLPPSPALSILRNGPESFKGRKPVTLDFEREEAALRILFDLVFEADIVKPTELRRKLRNQAKRVVAATT